MSPILPLPHIRYYIWVVLFLFLSHGARAQDMPAQIAIEAPGSDTAGLIRSLIDTTNYLVQQNRPEEAYPLLYQLIGLSSASGNTHGLTSGYLTLGICYTIQGRYGESLKTFREALRITEKPARAKLYSNMALPHYYQGRYDSAALYWYRSVEESIGGEPKTLANSYANLADVLSKFGKYDMALECLDKAAEAARHSGPHADLLLAHIWLNRGNIHEQTGDTAMARSYYTRALRLGQSTSYSIIEQDACTGLGRLELHAGRPSEALRHLQIAIDLGDAQTPYQSILKPYLYAGIARMQLQQHALAEQMLQSALLLALRHDIRDNTHEIHEALARNYEQTGNYRQAFTHYRQFHALHDELRDSRNDRVLNQLEVRYRVAEKDKEIAQKDSRIKEKNLWILGISSGSLLLSAGLTLVWSLYRNNRHKQHLLAEKLTNIEKEHEIKQLKASMEGEERERVRIAQDLHDGIVVQFAAAKMNLSALPAQYPSIGDSPEFSGAMQQLEQATRELRETAHNLLPDLLLESGIADAAFYFCRSVESGSGLKINFQSYGTIPRLDPDFELSVYRIIQELVHNIIKHSGASRALLQITCKDEVLGITVEDNGKGISEESLARSRGIGLKNVRSRIAALNGILDLISTPQTGTLYYLEFRTTEHYPKKAAND